MSEMAGPLFSQSPALWGPILALVLFGAVFLGVVIRTLRARREHIDALARMPLEDDLKEEDSDATGVGEGEVNHV